MCGACGNFEHVNAGFVVSPVVIFHVLKPVFTTDQIVAHIQTQWQGSHDGQYFKWMGNSVSYSLPATAPDDRNNEASGFQAMTQNQLNFAREAFEQWDDLIAINLNESGAVNAQITMANSSTTNNNGTYASSLRANGEITNSDIWLSTTWATNNNIQYSNYGFQTYLHEIGHALGLSHAGSYNAGQSTPINYANSAEFAQDNRKNTIMSYFGGYDKPNNVWTQDGTDGAWAYSSTPMLYDIAAIQAKYGADMTTRTGDTVYGYNSTANRGAFDFNLNPYPIFTIWDAGGNDTLDCWLSSADQRISLLPGTYSDIKGMKENVAIAFGATIENAIGGFGNDVIDGNGAVNRLEGRAGNDVLNGHAREDVMIGGLGNDTYHVDDNTGSLVVAGFGISIGDIIYRFGDRVIENANEGTDTVVTTVDYTLASNVENLELAAGAGHINGYGNSLANSIFGNEGWNTIGGGDGNDLLDGRGGADTASGGRGDDTYLIDTKAVFIPGTPYGIYLPGDQVIEKANEGIDIVFSPFSYTLTEHVEQLKLMGSSDLNGYGNAGDNRLVGNSGVNRLEAYAGNDVLDGLGGADVMVGGIGDDRYRVDNAGNSVVENAGEGTDTVEANFSFALSNNVENLVLDEVSLTGGSAPPATTTLTGNALANLIVGNSQANIVNGKDGADTMQGQAGNDAYYVDNAADRVVESAGQGTDVVNAFTSYTLGAGVSVETLRTVSVTATTAINLIGNELGNHIIGNAGNNAINGRGGVDKMQGLAGNDAYFVDKAGDIVIESAGTDSVSASVSYSLAAGVSVETLRTTDAAATTAINLTGNNLANTVVGNAGVNVLNGGAGTDKMTGGAGNDYFAFNTVLNATTNVDTITDFAVVNDTIRLDNAVFTSLAAGRISADAFHIGTAAADAEDRLIYNQANGALSYDANGTGAGGLVQFAKLAAGLSLTTADFVVV